MATLAGIALAIFLVLLLIVLVLMTNPPNKWVQKMSREKEEDGQSDRESR